MSNRLRAMRASRLALRDHHSAVVAGMSSRPNTALLDSPLTATTIDATASKP